MVAYFKQAKKVLVILLTLSKSKNQTDDKTPLGETGCLCIFFLSFFFECSDIQFFDSPPQSVRQPLVAYPSLCVFLVSPCYLQDAMPCQWLSSDLPRVLRIWESVFYTQAYLTLFPASFKASLGAGSSTSRLVGLHADLRNIAPARRFVWITTIHKRVILSRLI